LFKEWLSDNALPNSLLSELRTLNQVRHSDVKIMYFPVNVLLSASFSRCERETKNPEKEDNRYEKQPKL